MRNQKIPHFKLMYVKSKGEDKEMEHKIYQVFKDPNGRYIEYQLMEGDIRSIDLDKMKEYRYMPDYLRVAYHQIQERDEYIKKLTVLEKLT